MDEDADSSQNQYDEKDDRDSGAGSQRFSFATPLRGGRRKNGSSASNASSQASSNDHTNLLIQSAARSVLDGASQSSTPMSDDGSESALTASIKPAPSLESLETKPLPPMPDEQDRKRFIGCLAAVLASAYDYDIADECDDMTEAFREENLAYLEAAEEDVEPEESGERVLKHAVSDSFDYSDSDGAFENTVSTSSISRAPPSNSFRASSKASKELHKMRMARARHRKRRYNVLSKFLIDCSGYLLLEKGQAKAFLPMLTKLLVPRPAPKKPDIAASRFSRKSNSSSILAKKQKSNPTALCVSGLEFEGQDSPSEKILSEISESPVDDFASHAHEIIDREINDIEHLRPFLESMNVGGGFRCLALVLLQHLLHSKEGYDARIRSVLKRLGVLLLVHDMENDPTQVEVDRLVGKDRPDLVTLATRRFESLEHEIALRIIKLSRNQHVRKASQRSKRQPEGEPSRGITRQQLIRGLKVGAVGVAAGSLFAVTGGLAAPGIAAGLAAIAGGTAATAAVLTSTAAVTAIFGVGGGSLVAYKMNRRTQGVTEFEFRKETNSDEASDRNEAEEAVEAELFSTIAISGWLRDFCDFQRPWGVSPSNPWISDQLELLERFYAVHRPENIIKSEKILRSWEGEEKELWNLLKQKYGTDPDHLFPLPDGHRKTGSLTLEQREVLDQLLIIAGYAPEPDKESHAKRAPLGRIRAGWNRRQGKYGQGASLETAEAPIPVAPDMLHGTSGKSAVAAGSTAAGSTVSSIGFESVSTDYPAISDGATEDEDDSELPKHIATVWDYKSTYGGELYTVRWESELLKELCDSVSDLAFDLVSGGTAQILKHTALSALMSAVAWPYALVNAANMIDGTWTLAVERADEAGRELARSLLFSQAGHRPVTLVGFSFGARAIYSCLKELAKYQEKWSDYQEQRAANPDLYDAKKGEDSGTSLQNMREPASIVEDAVLLGLPNHLSLTSWRVCRQVVAGRLVNCFSQKDLILSLMFQFKRLKLKPVCGTCPVAISGVENIDVTDIILGHEQYCTNVGDVLKKIRHGQPFRSRPDHLFEPIQFEESSQVSDKFDV
ncbi:hypothetical protein ACA910_003053 [Epithemia clementina (nom. ined.)]